MKSIRLSKDDPKILFDLIAQLHIDQIHHGVVPRLGKRFLSTLYSELASAPKTGVWAITDEQKIFGFICGCAELKSSYKSVLFKPRFLFALLTSRLFLTPSLVILAFSVLQYPFRKEKKNTMANPPKSTAELLAIAVSPMAQGKGIGKSLVRTMEAAFLSWGVSESYRVTTNISEIGSNSFYQALGFLPAGTITHHSLTLQIYIKHLFLKESNKNNSEI